MIVQTAPATKVALGEEFGMEPGSIVEGKQVAALRALGFDAVLDTCFSADLTIMEEAAEVLYRLKNVQNTLPQFTSCCPGWVKFCEYYYPDLLEHMSSCKSPQQMLGAVAKTYYATKMGINPANIVSVAIMPCTAKKAEAKRSEMNASGKEIGNEHMMDVDLVLTTRELARLIKLKQIDMTNLDNQEYDSILGESTMYWRRGRVARVLGSTMTSLGCQKEPTMFFVSPRSTAVLPPMEESIIERVVVGQLMKSMPRI